MIVHSLIWFTYPALWGDGVEYNGLYSGTLKFPYHKGYAACACLNISRTYSTVKKLLFLVCKYGSYRCYHIRAKPVLPVCHLSNQ